MDTWGDYNAQMRMRDIIIKACTSVVDKIRPMAKRGTVISVDRVAMKAVVLKEDDIEPASIPIASSEGPWGTGDVVLIDNVLGFQRITKVLFSPTQPGGTYVQPAFVNPSFVGGQASDYKALQHYFTQGQDSGDASSATYIGRWTNDVNVLGWAEVIISQSASSGCMSRYSFPIWYGATGGVWNILAPDKRGNPGTAFAIELEANVSDDGVGGNSLELRVRQSAAGAGFGGPITCEVWLHGPWVKDPLAVEQVVTDPIPSLVYQTKYVFQPHDIWHVPSLLNSWSNFDGLHQPSRFYKDSDGFVHLEGCIKGGTFNADIFVLPAGYRPDLRAIFAVSSNGQIARLTIDPDGSVLIDSYAGGGSNVYVSLNGVSFYGFQ